MKKIILLLLLALVSISASARKSYITVYTYHYDGTTTSSNTNIRMTGDLPENIEGFVYNDDNTSCYNEYPNKRYTQGEILNLLSGYGYEVEFVDNDFHCFLLSKEIPSNQTQIEGDVNNDSEVNIADVNKVISLILDKIRENPNLLEELGIEQPK